MHNLRYLILTSAIVVIGGVVFFALANPTTQKQPTTNVEANSDKISAIIIPHHDLVKSERQKFLKEISQKISQPKTIILISPNHYQSGLGKIQVYGSSWDLINRKINPDTNVLNSITSFTSIENGSFANEHGIKNVLEDIWDVFPKAKIVPIIFKEKVSVKLLSKLDEKLNANCQSCLMVASVDFSHYQPALLANLHDDLTKTALEKLDSQKILDKAEVDSPPALALTALWAKSHQTEQFILDNHTNSGVITGQPDSETTSHFFGYYQSGDMTPTKPSVSFIIGGDMMFGRMIAHTFLSQGLWRSLDQLGDRVFWGTDASIINLEGPVSDVPVPDNIQPNNLVFNFPPETISALKYLKINVASQANNHSQNAGKNGISTTKKLLGAADIFPLGRYNGFNEKEIVSIKGNGLTLDIIGLNILWSQPNVSSIIKNLKKDPTHRVMVFYHGGNEYQPKHSTAQEQQAHAWIDAGADIVIGAHPHVVQDTELYKNTPIFYSLGNLLFDQTFSTETQRGLLVAGKFTGNQLELFALPTQSTSYKPTLVQTSQKNKLLNGLYEPFREKLTDTKSGGLITIDDQ